MVTQTQPSPHLDAVPLWRRFHIRLTAMYVSAVFLVLLVNVVLFYFYGFDRELAIIQSHLEGTAVTLSHSIDGERLRSLNGPSALTDPNYTSTLDSLVRISDDYPKISSIYVLLKTDKEGILRFAVDNTVGGENVVPGELYDARDIPMMLRGMEAHTVESQVVRDDYGVTLSGYAPLRDRMGQSMGVIGVDVDASQIDHIRSKVMWFSAVLLALMTLLMFVAAWLNGRWVREPLSRVVLAANAVAEGDFQVRLEMNRTDEFGLLGEQFNAMTRDLADREMIRETLGRYVSEEVAEAALKGGELLLGGEEREVTILFSDLRGYSTLSELLSPTEIVTFLNAYLGGMNEVIDEHLGCVIEYLGDAILAVFGAPNDLLAHPTRAVECAIAMQRRFVELNEEWTADGFAHLWKDHGLEDLSARIGVHTGRVVAGNLGSHTRMKYAVIGDTVNIAARLEQLNKPLGTDLLISQAVYDCLAASLQDEATNMGNHQVKGRQQEVSVFSMSVLDSSDRDTSTA